MADFKIPSRQEVSPESEELFANLEKKLGFVPNQYRAMATSNDALAGFLTLQDVRTSFGKREKMVVNLLVSQLNGSDYCIAQHTEEARGFDLSPAEITEVRRGRVSFDAGLDALAKLTKELVEHRGMPRRETLAAFYKAGYNYGHVVDLTVAIGEKTIANYVCNIAQPGIDTVQQFVSEQQEKGNIDDFLTSTRIADVWDCLVQGDDNSEDESKLGLHSDMKVWDAIRTVSGLTPCPEVITISHAGNGEWRRTTWKELIAAARNKTTCNE
jgi:AhpD family alkylhydroperoxidase